MSSKKINPERESIAMKPALISLNVEAKPLPDFRIGRLESIKARVLAGEYEAQPTLIAQSMWSHVKNWLQKSSN